jgi:hypothetical protein
MEMNPTEPIVQLTSLLGEITKMPLGPERDKKWEEAYALFAPAAEELSLLGGQMRVLAERNQNGETLKDFMKKAGIDKPVLVTREVTPQPKIRTLFKSRLESAREYWDRKKGPLAVGLGIALVGMFMLNYRNVQLLDRFIHDEDLVGPFEDWLGLTHPEDAEERETPLNWKELDENDNV